MLTKELFGQVDGKDIYRYTIENKNLIRVSLISYGAAVNKMIVPDKYGHFHDVVLGYSNLEEYANNGPKLGACIAPNANRIAKGLCPINGTVYQMEINDGENNLHTSDTLSSVQCIMDVVEEKEDEVVFATTFADGEAGLPGNRKFSVSYKLTDSNRFEITYWFTTDKDTIFNPTNHSYFNLGGHRSGNVFSQLLKINADYYTPVGPGSIPTGEIAPVEGTPFDFRHFKEIGEEFSLDNPQMALTNGYDHNFVIRGYDGSVIEFARLFDEESARMMICYTDMPGVQVYTANYLDNQHGKKDYYYQVHQGVCLETQFFPDSINHENFPSPIVKAGEEKCYHTAYEFILG